ncbi:MAG TPA: BadF/BadG/BcrA/BcrD ATPase family protein [bacterium]|nr:BadF/BadG/BcrA/BcrD ATPase family protein [bacterium]
MEYFLGVDGGATSTTCAVCDRDGRILGIGHGGPSNHILAPGGEARARAAIESALGNALAAAGASPSAFDAAQFGMTGINRDSEPARVFGRVVSSLLTARITQIDNDAAVALAGALAGGPGVVVIAGTGSVALGRDPSGREARAGGWGYLFGDEGSGFALGLGGVRAALRARDETGGPTVLETMIPQRFGADLGEIPLRYYEGRVPRSEIAALASAVTAAAADGDPVARTLVDDAAEGLAGIAAAVIRRLTWPDGTVAVAAVGGVFKAGPTLLAPLKAAIAARAAGAVLVPPRFAPAVGALLLAMRAAGVRPTPERLALLAATWELRSAA